MSHFAIRLKLGLINIALFQWIPLELRSGHWIYLFRDFNELNHTREDRMKGQVSRCILHSPPQLKNRLLGRLMYTFIFSILTGTPNKLKKVLAFKINKEINKDSSGKPLLCFSHHFPSNVWLRFGSNTFLKTQRTKFSEISLSDSKSTEVFLLFTLFFLSALNPF